jgi:hypothetical protein
MIKIRIHTLELVRRVVFIGGQQFTDVLGFPLVRENGLVSEVERLTSLVSGASKSTLLGV